jgi:L-fucose isomerase
MRIGSKGLVEATTAARFVFDWAQNCTDVKKIMSGISMPLAGLEYFPGGGNSVTFMTPAGIEGIAGRMAYCSANNKFSFIWDEAVTTAVPEKLGKAMCNLTDPTWPHTFLVPKIRDNRSSISSMPRQTICI